MKNCFYAPLLAALCAALTTCAGTPGNAPASASASRASPSYWSGDGAADLSIAVLALDGKGLSDGEDYLPATVQRVLASDLDKFSGMYVMDMVKTDELMKKGEDPKYAEDNNFVRYGEVRPDTQYVLTGALQKTGQGFSLFLEVNEWESGVSKASYNGNVQRAELEDFTGIKKASADLLAQMGVNLTDAGRAALLQAADSFVRQNKTLEAQASIASRNGAEITALSYFFQANSYDPTSFEAATQTNLLSVDISSGTMGQNIRSEIEWKNQWLGRLAEAEQSYTDYMRQQPRYSLVYDAALKYEIDFSNDTAAFSGITLDLVPDAEWFNRTGSMIKFVNVVKEGLLATKQAAKWGLDWPRNTVGNSPFGDRDQRFEVVVELLNADGKTLGRERVTVRSGYDVEWTGDRTIRRLVPRMQGIQNVEFRRVSANDIREPLAVRIASIDGVNAETAARTRGLNILTEADYAQLPEVAAGVDSRAVARFMKDVEMTTAGEITGYRGPGGRLVIPTSVFGLPVTSIGKEAFTEAKAEYENIRQPNGTTTTRSYTTYSGKKLTSVTIPGSVTTIGENAFRGNWGISAITISNGVTTIGENAFRSDVSEITIPDSVTFIGVGAFYGSPLTSITLPGNVTLDKKPYGYSEGVLVASHFDTFYNKNGKKAGTYTRPTIKSKKWSYRP